MREICQATQPAYVGLSGRRSFGLRALKFGTKTASIAAASLWIVTGAQATELDLSTLVNADLNQFTNGSNYPTDGGQITVGGVGFGLAPIANSFTGGNDTGVVQLNGDPAEWMNSFPAGVSISDGESGIRTVYTLINSSFGLAGTTIGSLEFVGSAGNYTFNLVEGVNVRDHYQGSFVNTASGLAASKYFGDGSVRLDMQAISLPGNIGVLESINFSANAQYYGTGEPFLAAVTTSTSAVPEPSTYALLLIGFCGLAFAGYRRQFLLVSA